MRVNDLYLPVQSLISLAGLTLKNCVLTITMNESHPTKPLQYTKNVIVNNGSGTGQNDVNQSLDPKAYFRIALSQRLEKSN